MGLIADPIFWGCMNVARAGVRVTDLDLPAVGLFRDLWRTPRSEKENAGAWEQVRCDARGTGLQRSKKLVH